MPTASPKLPPLPGPDVAVLDKNGLVDPNWYAWLKALERIVKILRTEIP
jgi:hypothetical protein